jgi:hypothetical protein
MLGAFPSGCAFNPRCPDRFEPCPTAPPADYVVGRDQTAKCYLHDPRLSSAAERLPAIADPTRPVSHPEHDGVR